MSSSIAVSNGSGEDEVLTRRLLLLIACRSLGESSKSEISASEAMLSFFKTLSVSDSVACVIGSICRVFASRSDPESNTTCLEVDGKS